MNRNTPNPTVQEKETPSGFGVFRQLRERQNMSEVERIAAGAWLLLAGTAGAIGSGLMTIGALERIPGCVFRFFTGVPCPGCGMTHALLSAFQGHWQQSLRDHPLGLPLLALWTLWLALGLRNRAKGRAFSHGFPLDVKGWRAPALLLLVFGIYGLKLAGIYL